MAAARLHTTTPSGLPLIFQGDVRELATRLTTLRRPSELRVGGLLVGECYETAGRLCHWPDHTAVGAAPSK